MPGAALDPLRLLVPDLPRTEALLPYLRRIDERRWYTNFGPLVGEFERRCAEFIGGTGDDLHCVSAASGSAALELALRALAKPPGSTVLLPAFTFPATAIAIERAGHRPLFCDVDAHTWVVTPDMAASLRARHRFDIVVPVAAFGAAIDVAGWDQLADRIDLSIVVDGAPSLGSLAPGRHVTIVYSLHATKPLGIGEGGLIATRNAALAARTRKLSNYGFDRGRIDEAGINAKLSEYAAAVGLAQLDRAAAIRATRDALWRTYREALRAWPALRMQHGLVGRAPANLVLHVPTDAGQCAARLADEGIETRQWYCPPLHAQPAFASVPRAGSLAVSDDLALHALGLPFHAELTEGDVQRIARSLARAATLG